MNPTSTTDDDIYVNDGGDFTPAGDYYPGEPEERKEAEIAEAAPVAASLPIMGEVKQWFADQIEIAGSVDNIQIDRLTVNGVAYNRQISVEAQVLAYQLLRNLLRDKAHEWDKVNTSE